jgi:hypothetical protein
MEERLELAGSAESKVSAELKFQRRDVRYWHLADIDSNDEHVCFWR